MVKVLICLIASVYWSQNNVFRPSILMKYYDPIRKIKE